MKDNMRVHYDWESDFLEISIGKTTECYAEEIEPGLFLRKDEKTNEIKSIGILGFKERSKNLNDIDLMLPIKITLTS